MRHVQSLHGESPRKNTGALNVGRRGEHVAGNSNVRELTLLGVRLKEKGGGEELNHERGQGSQDHEEPLPVRPLRDGAEQRTTMSYG